MFVAVIGFGTCLAVVSSDGPAPSPSGSPVASVMSFEFHPWPMVIVDFS